MPKMLFIRGGAVGDFILTVPAIKLVRDKLPTVELEILGYPSIAELAVAAGVADRVRSIEDVSLARFFAPGSELDPEWCAYFSSFDVVISYLFDPDQYFQDNLIRAGVETLFIGPFRMDESEPHIHAANQLGKPLESIALFLEQPWVDLSYASKPNQSVTRDLQPTVAVHPGSGSPKKNWPLGSWAQLLFELYQKKQSLEFVIISGEAERESISGFLAMLNQRDLPFRHLESLPLPELADILQQEADFFLGHDSGISHLAASTGIPGLILFGPTNPAIWAPPNPGFETLDSPTDELSEITVPMVMDVLEPKLLYSL